MPNGGPAPMGAFYNATMTPARLLGITPGTSSRAAGQALPPSSPSASGDDNGAYPWHPDSGAFWLVAFGVLTVFGVAGASVRVRAFKGHAGAELGRS